MFEWFCGRPTPDKIYAKSLEVLGLGYALWRPEPDPALGETHLGDVGFVRQGKFVRLLNFDVSAAEKKVTRWVPPFSNIEAPPDNALPIDRTENMLPAGRYSSHGEHSGHARAAVGVSPPGTTSAGIDANYSFEGSQGAALTLKDSADLEEALPSKILKAYILRNYDAWVSYALQERGLDIKPKDIVVVSGCIKTTPDWSATVFGLSRKTAASMSVGANTAPVAAAVSGSSTFTVTSSSIHRKGPGPPSATTSGVHAVVENVKKDHCVSIKRLKVRTRVLTMSKIVAGAGYHQLPGPGDGSGSALNGIIAEEMQEGSGGSIWGVVRESGHISDRLDVLLDYIFEVSGATFVVASDNDVERILGGRHVLDFSSYLRHVSKSMVQVTDGVGHVETQDLVCDEQKARFAERFIKNEDVTKWPNITLQAAGKLEDCQISYKPSRGNGMHFTKYKTMVFGDSNTMKNNTSRSIALPADGKLLAAATGNAIAVWRLQDGLTVQRLERDGHTHTIGQIAFAPDGQHVVSGADDKLALVWSIKTGDVVHRLEGHEAAVSYAAFSPNGAQVATRSKDSLRIWDASSGDLLHAITNLKAEYGLQIFFSADSHHLAADSDTSEEDTAVVVLDCRTGARIRKLRKQNIWCMVFSPSGHRIATGSTDGSAWVWDAASGKALLELKEHTDWVREVAFSPDGDELATASDDGTVVTCDSHSGERRFTFRVESVRGEDKERVFAVAYSPKNEFIACGAEDGCVRVWNRRTGAFVATFRGHTDWVQRVMFTSDGWNVLSYGDDHVVRLWSIRDALRLS
ncbi:WD40 repeat domain-containing protein [Phanerochaete sordida]|uniref:WD40 repeat domain-containing protein n=1 Tax=Phanerochaete sordida TaxID=48140 RepID=A0A9P3GS21_9APHY|nr:WD40 repeat domain-containing protein [Phanerochaete sordida]